MNTIDRRLIILAGILAFLSTEVLAELRLITIGLNRAIPFMIFIFIYSSVLHVLKNKLLKKKTFNEETKVKHEEFKDNGT